MLQNIQIKENHFKIIRSILKKHLDSGEAYVFGSRKKGTANRHSDLDILLRLYHPFSLSQQAEIGFDFSDSSLPMKIDIVYWENISKEFQEHILRDSIKFEF